MKDFIGKVAVVTGGASGIGMAMALRFAAERMKVVLADIEDSSLEKAASEVKNSGAKVIAVHTDVSKAECVDALCRKALDTFGAVHIVCNNAGVGPVPGPLWESTVADWQWVLGVNLWGVIHGIRTFVPVMLKQQVEGHIVNTASIVGLLSCPELGIYCATKHAVVSISESLYWQLMTAGSHIRASVLCPGFVPTRIADANRNRPQELLNAPGRDHQWSGHREPGNHPNLSEGILPADIAEFVIQAIRDERLYIITHTEYKQAIRARIDNMVDGEPDRTRESREARLFRSRHNMQ